MANKRSSTAAFSFVGLAWGTLMLTATLHPTEASSSNINRRIGIQFLSFSYLKNGVLPDGLCCDGQSSTGGQCVPDTCDTAFSFCVTHKSNGSTCDPYFETIPLTNNNSVTHFGKKIDPNNPNSTVSLITIPVSTMEAITVRVDVKEVSDAQHTGSNVDVGNFTMLLNTTHLFTAHPDWITYHFHNDYVSLSLNTTSFCSIHYYGPFCNISCDNHGRGKHFTCATNGTKVCNPGYEDPQCSTMIDLCKSAPCLHNATCQKLVNDFTCNCSQGYTGKTCDTPASQPNGGNSSANSGSPSDGDTNIGVIVGPVVGVLLLLLLALLLFLLYQRKRKRTVKPEEEQAEKTELPDEKENGVAGTDESQHSAAPLSTETPAKETETVVNVAETEN